MTTMTPTAAGTTTSCNVTAPSSRSVRQDDVVLVREHGKRLAQLLRFLAQLHDNHNDEDETSTTIIRGKRGQQQQQQQQLLWVTQEEEKDISESSRWSDFGGSKRIVCSTRHFQRLAALAEDEATTTNDAACAVGTKDDSPFSFYAAVSGGSFLSRDTTTGSNPNDAEAKTMMTESKKRKRGSFDDRARVSSVISLSSSSSRTKSYKNTTNHHLHLHNCNDPLDQPCWFRLKRMTTAQIPSPPRIPAGSAVERYVQDWMAQTATTTTTTTTAASSSLLPDEDEPNNNNNNNKNESSMARFFTLRRLEQAPKVPPDTVSSRDARQIAAFLQNYQYSLRGKLYHETLEPIYHRLFDYCCTTLQQPQEQQQELVWGLGQAYMLIQPDYNDDDKANNHGDIRLVVNGPLLEILVEVELMSDGALLVRPRPHTGVVLNQTVVAAILKTSTTSLSSSSSSSGLLSQLSQMVSELEPTEISPGQPHTYIPFLKRLAVQLSPGGRFQPCASMITQHGSTSVDPNQLVVTEAWCLYTRRKPNTVWARDAHAFADQVLLQTMGRSNSNDTKNHHQANCFLPEAAATSLPLATWSLTHGPGMLEEMVKRKHSAEQNSQNSKEEAAHRRSWFNWLLSSGWRSAGAEKAAAVSTPRPEDHRLQRPIFPLPTSEAQSQIADLLLTQDYPVVVCEGPPGTGKSQAVANLICSYLSQGKRVLVTSKNGPALSVIRNRLPPIVAELCVDVSMSELKGMRQLQRTVERLADRVSCTNMTANAQQCDYLLTKMDELEMARNQMDDTIRQHSQALIMLMQSPDGKRLKDLALPIIKHATWIMKMLADDQRDGVARLLQLIQKMLKDNSDCVSGFTLPLSIDLHTQVQSKAGSTLSTISTSTSMTIAALPLVGSMTGISQRMTQVQHVMSLLRVRDAEPKSKTDWETVKRAIYNCQELYDFQLEYAQNGLPDIKATDRNQLCELESMLEAALEFETIASKIDARALIQRSVECQELWVQRRGITKQIQHMTEQLVNARVVSELAKSFSPEAQSALIRFSQIAGKAKFSRYQSSKMTQRQQRRRQEYLDAFNDCCRFIPCWIMTTSQISDYLPPECLFDLIIVDEASQSDASILPGMLRAKQWCIVGDRNQVSPTEAFVSEDSIENLRAAVPASPFQNSLLPGHSFFDLCAQAFPRGRVVLSEHFRCAEEIITFSNEQFYDGRLVPLRLPTRSERLCPSIVDVRVPNGVKAGKVNVQEADEIVRLIEEVASDPNADIKPRTIGVISLVGDEQSRLIRRRLLDTLGPEKMSVHNILVGDPPSFQGAERDIVYISLVCSKGSVPTQSQMMYYQRANVALSRARDRCVLVRSLDLADIPSRDDVKVPIIEYFQQFAAKRNPANNHLGTVDEGCNREASNILKDWLKGRGFAVRSMGAVWQHAVCVECRQSDMRISLLVDCENESPQEWLAGFAQQKAIERVGWKCLRINALALLVDCYTIMQSVVSFLAQAGINLPNAHIQPQLGNDEGTGLTEPVVMDDNNQIDDIDPLLARQSDIVCVSSDDDDISFVRSSSSSLSNKRRKVQKVAAVDLTGDDDLDDPNRFGEVVNLGFLRANERQRSSGSVDSHNARGQCAPAYGGAYEACEGHHQSDNEDQAAASTRKAVRKVRRHRKLDKYARDGRWFPGRRRKPHDYEEDWYDTDSDLQDQKGQTHFTDGVYEEPRSSSGT